MRKKISSNQYKTNAKVVAYENILGLSLWTIKCWLYLNFKVFNVPLFNVLFGLANLQERECMI